MWGLYTHKYGMYVKYSALRQVRPSTCTTRVVHFSVYQTKKKKEWGSMSSPFLDFISNAHDIFFPKAFISLRLPANNPSIWSPCFSMTESQCLGSIIIPSKTTLLFMCRIVRVPSVSGALRIKIKGTSTPHILFRVWCPISNSNFREIYFYAYKLWISDLSANLINITTKSIVDRVSKWHSPRYLLCHSTNSAL